LAKFAIFISFSSPEWEKNHGAFILAEKVVLYDYMTWNAGRMKR